MAASEQSVQSRWKRRRPGFRRWSNNDCCYSPVEGAALLWKSRTKCRGQNKTQTNMRTSILQNSACLNFKTVGEHFSHLSSLPPALCHHWLLGSCADLCHWKSGFDLLNSKRTKKLNLWYNSVCPHSTGLKRERKESSIIQCFLQTSIMKLW